MDDNKVSTETPTPGSDEAIALGCICPVMDNGHGRGRGDGTFWIIEGCPVHDPNASRCYATEEETEQ